MKLVQEDVELSLNSKRGNHRQQDMSPNNKRQLMSENTQTVKQTSTRSVWRSAKEIVGKYNDLSRWTRVLVSLYILTVSFVALALMNLFTDIRISADKIQPVVPDVVDVLDLHGAEHGYSHEQSINLENLLTTIEDKDTPFIDKPSDDAPKWQEYAVAPHKSNKPRLAIVIDDMGMVLSALDYIPQLPKTINFAFLPYAENLDWQTRQIKDAGHELMVHLPMQPKNKRANPGHNALEAEMEMDDLSALIDWNLDRISDYVAVNNHMGSYLTEKKPQMDLVMKKLEARGVFYLDSMTSNKSVGALTASQNNVPYLERDVFLDNVRDPEKIKIQILKAIKLAKKRGYAIAIGHPYPETMQLLANWDTVYEFQEVELVPISQVMHEKLQENYRQYAIGLDQVQPS